MEARMNTYKIVYFNGKESYCITYEFADSEEEAIALAEMEGREVNGGILHLYSIEMLREFTIAFCNENGDSFKITLEAINSHHAVAFVSAAFHGKDYKGAPAFFDSVVE
jgi:hypothetical protein